MTAVIIFNVVTMINLKNILNTIFNGHYTCIYDHPWLVQPILLQVITVTLFKRPSKFQDRSNSRLMNFSYAGFSIVSMEMKCTKSIGVYISFYLYIQLWTVAFSVYVEISDAHACRLSSTADYWSSSRLELCRWKHTDWLGSFISCGDHVANYIYREEEDEDAVDSTALSRSLVQAWVVLLPIQPQHHLLLEEKNWNSQLLTMKYTSMFLEIRFCSKFLGFEMSFFA